jgi:hypothetical protein
LKGHSSALSFRRLFLIIAPLIAAVLMVAGVFLDPDIDESGAELAQAYADDPGRTQLSALSFHFAFIMWAPIVFILAGMVRGRGAWLANVGAILATLGATTLPGFLLVDFYDIAIIDAVGPEGYERIDDELNDLPGAGVLFITGFLGHFLCLPFALFAGWRGRLLPLWTPIVVTVGLVLAQFLQPLGSGLLLAAVAMVALSYALWMMDWRREPAPAATLSP